MSRENVEVVQALVDAWRRGEAQSMLDLIHPDVEWDASQMRELIPDIAEVFRGHAGMQAFWARWLSAWKDLQFEIDELIDAGDDVVMLIRTQRQWGRHSGIQTELPPYAQVFTCRDGKVVRWRSYAAQEPALEAVGLRGWKRPRNRERPHPGASTQVHRN